VVGHSTSSSGASLLLLLLGLLFLTRRGSG